MRSGFILPFLLLCACGGAAEPEPLAETYRSGRDALCLAGDTETPRAGLITYGPDDVNCSVTGRAMRDGDRLVIAPNGDQRCRIAVRLQGQRAEIGARSEQCAYYCGPAADFSGRTLQRSSDTRPVTDLAGDPLC